MKTWLALVAVVSGIGLGSVSHAAIAKIDKFEASPVSNSIIDYDYTVSWSSPQGYIGLSSLKAGTPPDPWQTLFSNIFTSSPGRITGIANGSHEQWHLHVGVKPIGSPIEFPKADAYWPLLAL
jgi:hypothetical protein